MRHLARFWIFFLGCVLLAALLSPWVYLGIQWSAATWKWEGLQYLARHPFHRYFNRLLQAGIAIGILGQLKSSGYLSFRALGFRARKPLHMGLLGLASSIFFLGGFAGLTVILGWHQAKFSVPGGGWMGFGLKVLLTALVVAFLEEAFFRGYFYQLCKKAVGYFPALALNALFFSILHYVKPGGDQHFKEVNWCSGFQLLGIALDRFENPIQILGGLLVLMWLAWMLCWSLDRTSSIYLAIGLHAGWILVLQWTLEVTRGSTDWPIWVSGGGNLSQGAITLIPLAIQFLFLQWWLAKEAKG